MKHALANVFKKNPGNENPWRGGSLLTGGLKVAGIAAVFTLVSMAVKKIVGWKEPVQLNNREPH